MIEHISKVTKEDVCEVMQLCKEKNGVCFDKGGF